MAQAPVVRKSRVAAFGGDAKPGAALREHAFQRRPFVSAVILVLGERPFA